MIHRLIFRTMQTVLHCLDACLFMCSTPGTYYVRNINIGPQAVETEHILGETRQ